MIQPGTTCLILYLMLCQVLFYRLLVNERVSLVFHIFLMLQSHLDPYIVLASSLPTSLRLEGKA
jgi:hypothetical protein